MSRLGNAMSFFGPAIIRVALGAVFVAHGAQKLFGLGGGGGLAGTAGFFSQLGLIPAYPLAMLVGLVEFGGGLLLIAGAFTVVASAVLMVTMLVAVWKVHLPYGFFLNWTNTTGLGHGYEFNLVLIAGLASLALTGPGALSVDRYRHREMETEAAGRARLRAGQI
jgi:putative oxidoreductase